MWSKSSSKSCDCLRHKHSVTAFACLNNMRKNSEMTDATLKVGEVRIHAHRQVLSSKSRFFFAMFNVNMVDEVNLDDLDVESVERLIEFAYTGEIQITEENVQALLAASTYLKMGSLVTACTDFMLKHISPTSCLGIRGVANAHSNTQLRETAENYVLEHFEQVVNSVEYLDLQLNEVMPFRIYSYDNNMRDKARKHIL